jgi:hypothetical protein
MKSTNNTLLYSSKHGGYHVASRLYDLELLWSWGPTMFPLHIWTFCLWSMVMNMPHLHDNAFQKSVATNSILSSQWAHDILCGEAPIMHMLRGVLTPEWPCQQFYLTDWSCIAVHWLILLCFPHTLLSGVLDVDGLLVLSHPPYWFIWLYMRTLLHTADSTHHFHEISAG